MSNSGFEEVIPSNNSYEQVSDAIKTSNMVRFDYRALARQYNRSPIGTIFILSFPQRTRLANLRTVFDRRDITFGLDYELHRVHTDSKGKPLPKDSRPITLKKLTTSHMKYS